jgi:hypothetical protein
MVVVRPSLYCSWVQYKTKSNGKRLHGKDSFPIKTCDKRMRKQMWKGGGGTIYAKGRCGGETRGEVIGMEPTWLGNRIK